VFPRDEIEIVAAVTDDKSMADDVGNVTASEE